MTTPKYELWRWKYVAVVQNDTYSLYRQISRPAQWRESNRFVKVKVCFVRYIKERQIHTAHSDMLKGDSFTKVRDKKVIAFATRTAERIIGQVQSAAM